MKRIVVVSLCLILVGVLVLGWAMFGDRSSFHTGLDSYEGLPHTASDISIYENNNMSGIFIADFKIAEHDFVSFAATEHWSLQPISGSASVFQAKAFHEGRPNDKREIIDGLYYITQSGQATEAELRWHTIGGTDVDTLTVALDNGSSSER